MQKGTRAVPGKQEASVIELVVDNSKIVVKLNIANQEKSCDSWPALDLAKKSSDGSKKSAFLSTWNFY